MKPLTMTLVIATWACMGLPGTLGSAHAQVQEESRKLPVFSAIKWEITGRLQVTTKEDLKTPTVLIRANRNVIPAIVTKVEDGTCIISITEGSFPLSSLTVLVTVPAIENLTLTNDGTGEINVALRSAKHLTFNNNGTGKITIEYEAGESLTINNHGTGVIKVSGTVKTLKVRDDSTGLISLANLTVESSEIDRRGVALIIEPRRKELDKRSTKPTQKTDNASHLPRKEPEQVTKLQESKKALADAQARAKNTKARLNKLHGAEFRRVEQELETAILTLERQIDEVQGEIDAAIDRGNDTVDDLFEAMSTLQDARAILQDVQAALARAEAERSVGEGWRDKEQNEKLKQELRQIDVAPKPGDEVIALGDVELRIEAKSVARVRKGGKCTIEQVQDKWLWVRHGDVRGWIDSRSVISEKLLDWYRRLPDNSSVEQSGTSRAKYDGILFEIVDAGQPGSLANVIHGATYNGIPVPWSLATTYSNLGIFTRKHGDRRELGLYLTAGQPLSGRPFSGLFEAALAAKSYGIVRQGDYVFVNPKIRLVLVNGERRQPQ